MPLIVTPRQFTQRAQFYQQLGQVTAAGLTILAALEMQARNPPARSFREPLQRVIQQIQQGATVSDAWKELGPWVSTFDLALLKAAENTGRLDAAFRMLANYYLSRGTLLRRIITDLLYPVFLFHFAIVLFPFISWFSSSMTLTGLVLRVFGVLIPLYAALLLMIYSSKAERGVGWKSFLERILRPIPVLGAGRHFVALARLAGALEALIMAGVGIIEAWEFAAAASGSPAIYRTVMSWRPHLASGVTPSELVNSAPREFPELFANLYHSGEVSGELDESLRRLRNYYEEEGTEKLHLVAQWVPRLIYFCIAGFVAYKVISFYSDYFNQIKQAGGF